MTPDFIIQCPEAERLGRSEWPRYRWMRRNGGKTMVLFFQNRRIKRLHCFSIEGLYSKISSGGSLEKRSRAGICLYVCLYVCLSVQAFSPLEPDQLVGSGRANIHLMHRNGGNTMVTDSNRSVSRSTCHVRSCKPLQTSCSPGCRPNQWTDSAQTCWADSYHGWA